MSEEEFYIYHSLIVRVRRRFATLNYAETVFALAIKVFLLLISPVLAVPGVVRRCPSGYAETKTGCGGWI
jgi:hypothetical protein